MDDAVALTRAVHEAGHCTLGWLYGTTINGASLEPDRSIGRAACSFMDPIADRDQDAQATIAGLVAEDVGRDLGFLAPLEVVTATEADEAPQPEPWTQEWRRIDLARMVRRVHDDQQRFELLIPQQEERALLIAKARDDLVLYWPAVERIALALFELVVVSGPEIHSMLEAVPRPHVDAEAEPRLA